MMKPQFLAALAALLALSACSPSSGPASAPSGVKLAQPQAMPASAVRRILQATNQETNLWSLSQKDFYLSYGWENSSFWYPAPNATSVVINNLYDSLTGTYRSVGFTTTATQPADLYYYLQRCVASFSKVNLSGEGTVTALDAPSAGVVGFFYYDRFLGDGRPLPLQDSVKLFSEMLPKLGYQLGTDTFFYSNRFLYTVPTGRVLVLTKVKDGYGPVLLNGTKLSTYTPPASSSTSPAGVYNTGFGTYALTPLTSSGVLDESIYYVFPPGQNLVFTIPPGGAKLSGFTTGAQLFSGGGGTLGVK